MIFLTLSLNLKRIISYKFSALAKLIWCTAQNLIGCCLKFQIKWKLKQSSKLIFTCYSCLSVVIKMTNLFAIKLQRESIQIHDIIPEAFEYLTLTYSLIKWWAISVFPNKNWTSFQIVTKLDHFYMLLLTKWSYLLDPLKTAQIWPYPDWLSKSRPFNINIYLTLVWYSDPTLFSLTQSSVSM
jgi:hypothetical protein